MNTKLFAAIAVGLAMSVPAFASDEVRLNPMLDSYNWRHNQPHGGVTWIEMFTEYSPDDRAATGMMWFDLSDLAGIEPDEVISAELRLYPIRATNQWGLESTDGSIVVRERTTAFDEVDPNPAVDGDGVVLGSMLTVTGDLSPIVIDDLELLGEVRSWVDEPASNLGLEISMVPTGNNIDTYFLMIATREWAEAALRPELVLGISSVPAPGVGALLGVGMVCIGGRRRPWAA
jgi:hypothetical protein